MRSPSSGTWSGAPGPMICSPATANSSAASQLIAASCCGSASRKTGCVFVWRKGCDGSRMDWHRRIPQSEQEVRSTLGGPPRQPFVRAENDELTVITLLRRAYPDISGLPSLLHVHSDLKATEAALRKNRLCGC